MNHHLPDPTPLNRWHAINPYGTETNWQGRAQITDGYTTEAATCSHHHGSIDAAWACGRRLADQLQHEEVAT